ncbi:N-acetyltransferase [Sporosarcina sp. NCCP-2222]|uniref:GNAT family N-acetyltransferase n=1 Tax=Sporosarcina sp. NCCP-2222 TaxID=2935073 RepID=UPI002081C7D7|nr:N-acetyltransferase [Sporosarcina sp. NCCP-2222]GKV55827.1 N-acetyltransferase [Sporosarcina sp. NCCP-2222]
MAVTIETPRSIRGLAGFLAEMNNKPAHHIGYCGEQTEEIIDTLQNDFSDVEWSQSFKVAYEEDCIVGALGFDLDYEDRSAEVWGPFVLKDDLRLAETLWKSLYNKVVDQVDHFHFFYSGENELLKQFLAIKSGIEKGKHVVLAAQKGEQPSCDTSEIVSYEASCWEAFKTLHKEAFPKTYYDAETICSQLNEQNQLLVLKADDQQIKGYVYIEADPAHGEGSIEYIAVSNAFRKQGIGTRLLQEALLRLFAFKGIDEIRLCVNASNTVAIGLYKAAGFDVKNDLIHSLITLGGNDPYAVQ